MSRDHLEMTQRDMIAQLLRETLNDWWADNAMRRGAALAYYTTFSVAPLLIVAIAVAGVVFRYEDIEGRLLEQMRDMIGPQGAEGLIALVRQASQPMAGLAAAVISVATMLLGASGVFLELQQGLNEIWHVPAASRGPLPEMLRARFASFLMVLGLGVVLLLSLTLNTAIATVNAWFGNDIAAVRRLVEWLHVALSFGLVAVLFAMIFKLVPDAAIAWGDVWIGALGTALLFLIGQWLFGLYIAFGAMGSVYGGAGSLVLLLLWVYYASQILFLGAEFTQAYARMYGSRRNTQRRAVSGAPQAVPH